MLNRGTAFSVCFLHVPKYQSRHILSLIYCQFMAFFRGRPFVLHFARPHLLVFGRCLKLPFLFFAL